jgi:hypothetical protein
VGSPSVVAEGLEPCEDFIDGHADDCTRNSTLVAVTRAVEGWGRSGRRPDVRRLPARDRVA